MRSDRVSDGASEGSGPEQATDGPTTAWWRRVDTFWWVLIGLFAAAFAVRVVSIFLWYRNLPLSLDDNYFYHHQARLLADGQGFINPFLLRQQHVVAPSAAHPPGYSLYLALWSLLGVGGVTDHRIVTGLLGATLVFPMGLIGRRLHSPRAGWIAAGFAAFWPPLFINDGLLLSETLAAVVVAWTVLVALWAYERPSIRRFGLLGVAIGLGALSRSELILFAPLLALPLSWMAARQDRQRRWATFGRYLAAAAAGVTLLVAPWVIRNMTSFDNPVTLSSGTGFVLEIANCDATYGGTYLGYWSPDCDTARWPATADESVIEAAKRDQALDYITSHPKRAAYVAAVRVLRVHHLAFPRQGADFDEFFERRPAPLVTLGLLTWYPVMGLAAMGLWRIRRRGAQLLALGTPIIVTVFATAVGIGITRYRITADVAWASLAAVGIVMAPAYAVEAKKRFSERFLPWLSRRFACVLGGVSAAAIGVRWFIITVTWPTCPTDVPDGKCFRVWGDALYSSLQGVLAARGFWYKNGYTWRNIGYIEESASDPPFYAGFLGAVGWFGRPEVPWPLRAAVAAVLIGATYWLVRRFVGERAALGAAGVIAFVLSVITLVGGEDPTTQRLMSALFGGIAVVFAGLAVKELVGPFGGVVAALLVAFDPLFWINDVMLMSESPYVAFLAFALWAAIRFFKNPSWGWTMAMAIGVGLAGVTRSESAMLYVLMVFPLMLRAKGFSWKQKFTHLAASAAVAVALFAPWLAWNSVRFKDAGITTMTAGTGAVLGAASCDATYYGESIGYWALCYNEPYTATGDGRTVADTAAEILGDDRYVERALAMCSVLVDGRPVIEGDTVARSGQTVEVFLRRIPVDPKTCPTGVGLQMDESETDGVVRGMALRYIDENRDRLPALAVYRVGRMLNLYGPMQSWRWEYQVEGRGYWSALIGMVMWWVMAIPAAFGLFWLARNRLPVVPFVAVIVAICVTAAGAFGINRYRVPMDLVEVMLFSVAVGVAARWWTGQRGQEAP